MTSPVIVGAVGVEVSASAKGFARRLREAVVAEFKGAGLDKALADALGSRKIKVPVEPEFDKRSLPRTLPNVPRPTRTPGRQSTPDTDALMKAFQDDVRRQIRALSREAIRIPVRPDTDDLRAGLAQQIAAVEKKTRITVPTEAGGRGDYERDLRRMLDDVTTHVRRNVPPVTVPVKVDTDPLARAFQRDITRQLTSLANTANLRIPVTAETAGLRARVAAEVAAVQRAVKMEVPTEPGSRAAYEARLRAMVASVSRTVRVSIPVDIDQNRFQRAVASLAGRLPGMLGPALQRVGDSANAAASAIGQAMLGAATSIFSMVNPATAAAVAIGGTIAVLLALGPAVGAAAGAIGVLAGALASLPALAVGGAATFGAFGLALRGIGSAFKDTAKAAGGGGASIAAQGRQIAAAQRGIAQAQRGLVAAERNYQNALRDSLRAQRAVNDARKLAARRIEDLGRALRRTALDEREAALRVREAERALNEAYRSRDPLEVERAQLELEQAQLAAEEAIIATRDAAAAKAEADRKGIEGSDEVVAALDRQQQAADQLASASDGLKSAQEGLVAANESLAAAQEKAGGSAGGLADKLIKLAPAAQAFVDQIKAMKPAFERLRLDVQQKAFDGLDKTVQKVGKAWLPQLHKTLGDYATTFNGFFKNLGKNISTPAFISNIGAGAESVRQAIERIGRSVSGPLVDAFGRLSRAAKPFIDAFGDEVGKLVDDFSRWVKSADKSGNLEGFFERMAGYLRTFFDVGRDVGSIIGSLIEIIFGADEAGNGSGFADTISNLADFLKDPENQRKLSEYVATLKEMGRILIEDVLPPVAKFAFWLITTKERIDGFLDRLRSFLQATERWADEAAATIEGLPGRISAALGGLGDLVGGFFSNAISRATGVVGGWLTTASQQFGSVRGRVTSALASVPGAVLTPLRNAVSQGAAALGALPGRAAAAVSSMGSRVRNALGDTRGLLVQAGRNVIAGLIQGIRDMFGPLGDIMSRGAQLIRDHFPYSPAKRGPLSGKGNPYYSGQSIVQLLSDGVTSRMSVAAGAADALASAFLLDVDPLADLAALDVASVDLSATALPAPPPAGDNAARIEWVGDAPGSFFRWVRENVRVLHGGDANAAFGRAPTPALAR